MYTTAFDDLYNDASKTNVCGALNSVYRGS